MDSPQSMETPFLVLRKTPFSDSSLVVAGVTPLDGQLHLLLKGALRLGAKRFPMVDLFRLLHISCHRGRGELYHVRHAELAADYTGVARHAEAYTLAGWLARFALANLPEGIEHPRFFQALCIGLSRLADVPRTPAIAGTICAAVSAGVLLTYMDEGGWLAADAGREPGPERCAEVLAMAAGAAAAPRLSRGAWQRLTTWILRRLAESECILPKTGLEEDLPGTQR
ncbi:MAG: recombination protein O N-terminal domain-containing protein [Lentisphaeria bacterium]|nr:recombination protein O N-terminal domain-containing protein [Lentisphaeria bacterium]